MADQIPRLASIEMPIAEVIADLRRHHRFALMTDEEVEAWMREIARQARGGLNGSGS